MGRGTGMAWTAAIALLSSVGTGSALSASLPSYPTKPVRIVVAFAPGGNIDITARTIAPGLSEFLGQPVVVDNRGGAGGRIGSAMVAKSVPDGYTVLLGAAGTLAVQPAFHDDIDYNPLRDFVFTAMISYVPSAIVVHPALPVRTTRDLIELARKQPGSILLASAGTGSNVHLMGELFQSMAKVKFTHVPYKGSGAALVDMIAGQVHVIFDQISASGPFIKAGKLRAIAVTTQQRSKFMPEVPTIHESGLPGYESATYTTLAIPAASPPEAVQRLRDGVLHVIAQPKVRESFERLGAEVIQSSPDDFARRVKADFDKWVRIRRETGIKVN